MPAELKPKLLPLEYFPVNEGYSVPAGLKTLEKFEPVDLVDVHRQHRQVRARRTPGVHAQAASR